MEGRVSHNKKSAALILSVLLPFSPTPRLYGDPFDKKHKDPKGAGGVKKCNGVRLRLLQGRVLGAASAAFLSW